MIQIAATKIRIKIKKDFVPKEAIQMEKVREMNKSIFQNNLLMALNEIFSDIDEEKIKFKVVPVYETISHRIIW